MSIRHVHLGQMGPDSELLGDLTELALEHGPDTTSYGSRYRGRGSTSVDASPRGDPCVGLAGDSGDVFEVGVIVQDHRAVVFGDGGGE